MNNESFNGVPQKSKNMAVLGPQTVRDNLKPNRTIKLNRLSGPNATVFDVRCCDDDMRERYRI